MFNKDKLHELLFESDTASGRFVNLVILVAICASVGVIMLDSVPSLNSSYGTIFYLLEWAFTLIFTVEYVLRIVAMRKPAGYVFSFYGLIDLLSILPTYVSMFFPGSQHLLVLRVFRLLRLFRLLKMSRYIEGANQLSRAMIRGVPKITVFFFFVLTMVIITGAVMHLVEGPANGFTSIPTSMYWAIVTLTTVGYGDITPLTPLGRFLASVLVLIGYTVIAVPTGIMAVELTHAVRNTQVCKYCGDHDHMDGARYCKKCGKKL